MKKSKVGIIILAGGYGSFRPGVPKLLEPVTPDGVTMIGQTARSAYDTWGYPLAFVVSRLYGDAIYDALATDAGPFLRDARPVFQGDKRGAADALYDAARSVGYLGINALVMFGDMPLWRPATMKRLMETHLREEPKVTMATVGLDLPGASPRLARYGRVVRDGHGEIMKVVEPAEATEDELGSRTVNPSLYVFDLLWYGTRSLLLPYRSRVDGHPPEKEIPGVIEMAYRGGERVVEVPIEDPTEALGVNTPEELEEVRRILAPDDGIRSQLGIERVALPFDRAREEARVR